MAGQDVRESIEGRLCGEVAAALARFLTSGDKKTGAGQQGARCYYRGHRPFERGISILSVLGCFGPPPFKRKVKGLSLSNVDALTMDADDMPDFLATRVAPGDDRIPWLLKNFLGIACDHDGLSDERRLFSPPPQYLNSMIFLARAGYAHQVGSKFRWTDKIADAMRENYLWDERLRSVRTLKRSKIEADAELAWRTMPEDIRRYYLSQPPANLYGVAWILKCCWNDERWQPMVPQDEGFHPSEVEVELARLVIALAEDKL